MSDGDFDTTDLNNWLERLKAGDRAVQNALLRATQRRLENLAARMLRKFPRVGRWAEIGDVLSNASMRLLRALESVPVTNTKEYFNLAAMVMRRELIDLTRRYYGPHGVGANHDSHTPDESGPQTPDREARDPDPAAQDGWTAFHKAVEKLPPEEREVFGLIFYHQWQQNQIAELFEIDERTVRRRFKRAAEILREALKGELPEG
jgi:RNA polymerase sigma-70 factor (ECF subfamily)